MSERTTQSTIDFESALHEALTSKADAAGGSISELVNSAIRLLLIEDQQDLAVFEERTDEETVPHENFLNHLETTDLLSDGEIENTNNSYNWSRAFDREEIQALVAEVSEAYRSAASMTENWENLEAVIHEWRESAIAILSQDLTEALLDTEDEVPLTPPAKS
ncbi:MAG: hypothetical protein AAFN40_02850 [Cyanobacteria bacterium J06560_6]